MKPCINGHNGCDDNDLCITCHEEICSSVKDGIGCLLTIDHDGPHHNHYTGKKWEDCEEDFSNNNMKNLKYKR